MSQALESDYKIGQRVTVAVIQNRPIYGYVRAITFTASKVRYAVWVREAETTLHNIDSAFVFSEPNAEVIDMPEDNYS